MSATASIATVLLMLKQTIFREYDIRGIADEELLSPDVEQLGRAIGSNLLRQGGTRLNVGRDVRLSSDRLSEALVKGILATGCEVVDVGVVPTPLLYYSVQHLKADGGVMITGSHNPAEYNGFKVVVGASTIHGDAIQQLFRIIDKGEFASGAGKYSKFDIESPYVNEIASQFQWDRRLRVVIDAGNGTAGPAMHRLLEKLNVEVRELYFEMDGRFPNHHPDPTVVKNLADLVAGVRDFKADLGIAFDGDADRIGAVDEQGNVVWGDYLLLIYAREILSRKPGATFIGEVKCSQVMYDELEKLGGRPIMYKTGHSLIKAKMKEEKAELAGEMSGHMFFKDRYFGFDDALYAACRLMEIVANSGQPLSAQTAGLPMMVSTPELRVDTTDEAKFAVVARVLDHYRKTHRVVEVDGARVIFPEGWGLVRASNTQPVLVMRFEASSVEKRDEYRREVEQVVAAAVAATPQ